MAVLEFLSATAWAWVVASYTLFHSDWFALCILAGIVLSCGFLVGISKFCLALAVSCLLVATLGVWCNLYVLLFTLLHRDWSSH